MTSHHVKAELRGFDGRRLRRGFGYQAEAWLIVTVIYEVVER